MALILEDKTDLQRFKELESMTVFNRDSGQNEEFERLRVKLKGLSSD